MAIGGYSRTKETEKQKTENQRGSKDVVDLMFGVLSL